MEKYAKLSLDYHQYLPYLFNCSISVYSECEAGTYSNSGSSVCVPCPAGQYQPSTGEASCLTCPDGTEVNSARTGCSRKLLQNCKLHVLIRSMFMFCLLTFTSGNASFLSLLSVVWVFVVLHGDPGFLVSCYCYVMSFSLNLAECHSDHTLRCLCIVILWHRWNECWCFLEFSRLGEKRIIWEVLPSILLFILSLVNTMIQSINTIFY